jgi:PQQ-like domain
MHWVPASLAIALGLSPLMLGCGAGGSSTTGEVSAVSRPSDTHVGGRGPAPAREPGWPRFGYDAARTDHAPRGLDAAEVRGLHERRVSLPGTVDSSPIYLSGARIGNRRRNAVVVTTTYGRTLALAPPSGQTLWTFTPDSYGSLAGSPQITNASPVASPGGRYVYAASPDGLIHKLRSNDGAEARSGRWPVSVTRDPTHEKIGTALNLAGGYVLVGTGGYIGDAPPYQGKVVAIDRRTGGIEHVFNSLCSGRRRIIEPGSCPAQRSAIWSRAGAVVDPASHRIFVATGNGPFDGRTNWGNSVLELAPGAAGLRRHYTPRNFRALEQSDDDLGSTSPALLPSPRAGGSRFLLQGGKDGRLRLLRLATSLSGVHGGAGRRLGGQVQTLPLPGGEDMFTAPAVLHRRGLTRVFVTTGGGTAAYRLRGGRLHAIWSNGRAGTSPVIAGELLWVYDPGGSLAVYRSRSGRVVRILPAPPGHWNSPIVVGARAYLPSGDANDHSTTGALSIYGPS